MQICVTQREGIRYFSRFRKIIERDRLEIEVTIEDEGKPGVIRFDLTPVLLEEYRKHSLSGVERPQAEYIRIDEKPATAVKKKRKMTSKRALRGEKRAR
ncbi:MAG: hypothetical protein Q7N50_03535 [Armatimonadota bacterium]|nr:hypothetical protein [Armatimonadota bacterium]